MTDNEYADIMMYESYMVKQEPAEALQRLRSARDKVETMRAKMGSIGAIRYDRDPVQTSHTHDLADDIAAMDDAEYALWIAQIHYLAAYSGLRMCCAAAGFSRLQTSIWMMYYGNGRSMGSIAALTGRSKSQVQYMLTGVRAERDFCLGIDRIATAASETYTHTS